MPNLRCERFGPFDLEELGEEIGALEFEYMMDLAPSKPPSVVRLCECKDEDYEGYHVRLFVGDYEYCVEEGNEAEDVKAMLEKTLNYETYAEQDLEGVPRFHNWFMALPGKSPYDKTYVEECRIRAEAFFKEKEERKKAEELIKTQLAAEEAAASKAWTDTPEAERDVAVLFPGQGTQKVGMAGKLLESPAVQGLFELSSKILGYDMVGLCAQGPQEKLDTTLYSQPAVFVCALAAMEKAKKEAPDMLKKVKCAAGFSLGEYSALVFGGALSFEDGLRVVKARAEAMDAAAKATAEAWPPSPAPRTRRCRRPSTRRRPRWAAARRPTSPTTCSPRGARARATSRCSRSCARSRPRWVPSRRRSSTSREPSTRRSCSRRRRRSRRRSTPRTSRCPRSRSTPT